jgi:RNA polymerase sigma factor (sigma-70 family)
MAVDSFGDYLKRVGKYSVLSADEERQLGTRIRQFMEKVEYLTKHKLNNLPLEEQCKYLGITPSEYKRLELDYKRAKEKLVLHNIKFVAHIAKRYQTQGECIEDLVSEGTIGLNRAAEKFKPEKGYKFSTYAYWWIKQAITKTLTCNSRVIRLPPDIYNLVEEVKREGHKLAKELGYEPTVAQIAQRMGKNEARIYQAVLCCKKLVSLNVLKSETEDTKTDNIMGDSTSDIDDKFISVEILEQLSKIQQYIIIRKFGLDGATPDSYKNIAIELGYSLCSVIKQRDLAFETLKQLCKV